ncbi:MAG: VOC family protein [Desulfarculaceae bacterium]|nr:VOC family protein [Desulfarculaceae bacterium]MCF8073249.1 VOC family protein [Desulfarculaceae bacterium]MCF8100845.1 VOC family protein [Desulfarculaceae bacterium]
MIGEFLHVAIAVEDLERSIAFYTEVMGLELDYRAQHAGELPARISGVSQAELEVVVLKKGPARIELTDYRRKEPAGSKPQNQHGLTHIAFLVEGIDQEYERIAALGYRFNSPPLQSRPGGPKVCYFHGPDNVVIELYQTATAPDAGRARPGNETNPRR